MNEVDRRMAYEGRIGELFGRALRVDEETCDRVSAALGVASRHLERLRTGQLTLTPAVEREIDQSFERAEALLK
jgi:hypothetical protein